MSKAPLFPVRWYAALLLTAVALVAAPAHAGDGYGKKASVQGNIAEVAAEAGQFETLLAAAKAAGLVETLVGAGPLTVFAPTDAAFAALPAGTVESLLKPENREQLRSILTYHVVPGKVMAADVVKLASAKTANGQAVKISTEEGGVMVSGARVVKADIGASNGVIHVIDKVMIPAS